MPDITYEFRDGYRFHGDPRAIGSRIEALKRRHATPEKPEGDTSPEEVLEDARSPDSPLHDCFTWDLAKAARAHHIREAVQLINCYRVVVLETDRKPIVIDPANVRIREPEGRQRYVSTSFALSKEDTRKQVLDDAAGYVTRAQERVRKLKAISPEILSALDRALKLIQAESKTKRKGSAA